MATIVVGPRAPLVTIDVSKVTILVGPLIPNAHSTLLQPLGIRIALQEPQEFVDDRLQMQFFCCEERESLLQVESHLIAKYRDGASAGAVSFLYSFFQDAVEQVKILFHCSYFLIFVQSYD